MIFFESNVQFLHTTVKKNSNPFIGLNEYEIANLRHETMLALVMFQKLQDFNCSQVHNFFNTPNKHTGFNNAGYLGQKLRQLLQRFHNEDIENVKRLIGLYLYARSDNYDKTIRDIANEIEEPLERLLELLNEAKS